MWDPYVTLNRTACFNTRGGAIMDRGIVMAWQWCFHWCSTQRIKMLQCPKVKNIERNASSMQHLALLSEEIFRTGPTSCIAVKKRHSCFISGMSIAMSWKPQTSKSGRSKHVTTSAVRSEHVGESLAHLPVPASEIGWGRQRCRRTLAQRHGRAAPASPF